jgi:hypothetical protein
MLNQRRDRKLGSLRLSFLAFAVPFDFMSEYWPIDSLVTIAERREFPS